MSDERLSVLFQQLPSGVRVHCTHTSIYARILAEKADGLSLIYPDDDRDEILFAVMEGGLYHDIGKLGLSAYILNKKTGLSDMEWQIVKKHPYYGVEILDQQLSADMSKSCRSIILDMARYHHERVDGSGYPYGISGHDIPLVAQICSVADAFDAMTTNRRYRKTSSMSAAYQSICSNAGSQFGEAVIECFKKAFSEMSELYKSGKSTSRSTEVQQSILSN